MVAPDAADKRFHAGKLQGMSPGQVTAPGKCDIPSGVAVQPGERVGGGAAGDDADTGVMAAYTGLLAGKARGSGACQGEV